MICQFLLSLIQSRDITPDSADITPLHQNSDLLSPQVRSQIKEASINDKPPNLLPSRPPISLPGPSRKQAFRVYSITVCQVSKWLQSLFPSARPCHKYPSIFTCLAAAAGGQARRVSLMTLRRRARARAGRAGDRPSSSDGCAAVETPLAVDLRANCSARLIAGCASVAPHPGTATAPRQNHFSPV